MLNTTVTCGYKGHQFAATLRGDYDDALVSLRRDGVHVCDVRWDGEDFVPVGEYVYLLPECDDSENAYRGLRWALQAKEPLVVTVTQGRDQRAASR